MKKHKYRFLWGDWQPPYTFDWNIDGFIKYRDFPWQKVDNIIEVSENCIISCFHSTKDLQNDIKRGKLYFDKKFRNKFVNDLKRDYKNHWNFFNNLKKVDWSNASDADLWKYFKKAMENCSRIISYFRATQQEGIHYLVEEIKKHFSAEELSIIMMSPEMDLVLQEQVDWEKLLKNQKNIKKKILKHAEKYPWIVASHFTYEDVFETLMEKYSYDKKHLKFKDIKTEKKELKKKQDKILKKKPELKELVMFVQRINLSRMEVKSCWAGTDFYIIPLMNEIAKRKKESIHELCKYYFIKEVKELIEGKKISKNEKIRRKECLVMLWKNKKKKSYSGDEAKEVAKRELKELYEIKETDVIKGTIANLGKARGTARILNANDVEKTRELRKNFKKGEILITQMTQPNIMDIASRASALVTDEGGMLSHAAIISREMKIPCIVGTKVATKVLKDGDLVEVDANKGIVKKIK